MIRYVSCERLLIEAGLVVKPRCGARDMTGPNEQRVRDLAARALQTCRYLPAEELNLLMEMAQALDRMTALFKEYEACNWALEQAAAKITEWIAKGDPLNRSWNRAMSQARYEIREIMKEQSKPHVTGPRDLNGQITAEPHRETHAWIGAGPKGNCCTCGWTCGGNMSRAECERQWREHAAGLA